jgi:U3 small nucleolar RNA-associated protein 12
VLIFSRLSSAIAISSLNFSEDGKVLASGSADCDIIVWDLVAQVAINRLRGHKDSVTGIAMFSRNTQQLLVSVSKDSLMKVWDLATNYCLQTIVGHRCEIWTMSMIHRSKDTIEFWTGSSDEWIRGYRVVTNAAGDETTPAAKIYDEEEILEFYGSIRRNQKERCTCLVIDASSRMLASVSTSKVVDFYRIRSAEECKKKMKRRLKRKNESAAASLVSQEAVSISQGKVAQKRTREAAFSAWDESLVIAQSSDDAEALATDQGTLLDPTRVILSDEIEYLPTATLRCNHRVRGFDFSPQRDNNDRRLQMMISFLDNSMACYELRHPEADDTISYDPPLQITSIDMQGHRADVRAVALSEDGLLIATCSAESVKIWNSVSLAHVRSCSDIEDGLSLFFTPGARYLVIGTKQGHIQVPLSSYPALRSCLDDFVATVVHGFLC